MALSETVIFVALSTNGGPVNGATVAVHKANGDTASIFADRAGTQPLSSPLLTVNGRVTIWLPNGSYKVDISKTGVIQPQTQYIEAVSGDDFATGATPKVYVQPIQPSASDDFIWIQTGLGSGGTDWTIWFNDDAS